MKKMKLASFFCFSCLCGLICARTVFQNQQEDFNSNVNERSLPSIQQEFPHRGNTITPQGAPVLSGNNAQKGWEGVPISPVDGCASKFDLEKHKMTEHQHLQEIKDELRKLQDLVQILKNQQLIVSMLDDKVNDFNPKQKSAAPFVEQERAKTAPVVDKPIPIKEGNTTKQVQELSQEVTQLKVIVNDLNAKIPNEDVNKELELQLEKQESQIMSLKKIVDGLASSRGSSKKLKNNKGDSVLGIAGPFNLFNRVQQDIDDVQDELSYFTNQTATKLDRSSEVGEEDSDLRTRSGSSSLKKLLKALESADQESRDDNETDLEEKIRELQQQLQETKKQKSKKTGVENQLRELKKQIDNMQGSESKSFDEEDDLSSQLKRIEKQLRGENDESSILEGLQSLQDALDSSSQRDEFSDKSKVDVASDFQFLLGQLLADKGAAVKPVKHKVVKHPRPSLSPYQLEELKHHIEMIQSYRGDNYQKQRPHYYEDTEEYYRPQHGYKKKYYPEEERYEAPYNGYQDEGYSGNDDKYYGSYSDDTGHKYQAHRYKNKYYREGGEKSYGNGKDEDEGQLFQDYGDTKPSRPQYGTSPQQGYQPQPSYGGANHAPAYAAQEKDHSTDMYTQQKVDDLKAQIYNLQNIIDEMNRPEYVQTEEDKKALYKLHQQITNLKSVISTINPDSQNIPLPGYSNQNYPPVYKQDKPVSSLLPLPQTSKKVVEQSYPKKENVYSKSGKARSRWERDADFSGEPSFIDEGVSILKNLLDEEPEEDELVPKARETSPDLNDLQSSVSSLREQLERRLEKNRAHKFRYSSGGYQPQYPQNPQYEQASPIKRRVGGLGGKGLESREDKFVGKIVKIITKIVQKVFDVMAQLLFNVFRKFVGLDFDSLFNGGGQYEHGYGNYRRKKHTDDGYYDSPADGNNIQLIFSNVIYLFNNFMHAVQRNKFIKYLLVPLLAIGGLAAVVVVLVWWFTFSDKGGGGYGYGGGYGPASSGYGISNKYRMGDDSKTDLVRKYLSSF